MSLLVLERVDEAPGTETALHCVASWGGGGGTGESREWWWLALRGGRLPEAIDTFKVHVLYGTPIVDTLTHETANLAFCFL